MSNITKLNERGLTAIVVPGDATDINIWNHGIGYKSKSETRDPDDTNGFFHLHTGLGRWRDFEILGEVTADSISFDVYTYVVKIVNDKMHCSHYKNYIESQPLFYSKERSFYSLLQSKGLFFVNPMGDNLWKWKKQKNESFEEWKGSRNQCQSYEEKLVKKIVILNKY